MPVSTRELDINYPSSDANKLFYKPLFVNDDIRARFRLMPNVVNEKDLYFLGRLKKILKTYQGCNPSPTGGTAPLTKRKVTVARHEFLLTMCWDEFVETLFEGATKFDKDVHDLTRTEFRGIMVGLIQDALTNDIYRKFWFDKLNAAAVADPDYNTFTGMFKHLDDLVTASAITYTNIVGLQGAPLPANQAPVILRDMKKNATKELRKLGDSELRYYVTKSIYDNLKEYYQALQTEEAHRLQVAGIDALLWDGVPVIEECWEEEFDFLGLGVDHHRAVLSTPQNLVVASDSGMTEPDGISIWYDRDTRLVKFEGFLKLGANYVHEAFLSYAK